MAHLAGCPLKDVECECIWMHQDKEFTCEGCSCVCPELKIGRNSTLNDAADAVERYADETHMPHSRFTTCLRCDITAALYMAAQRVREMKNDSTPS